MDEKKENVNCPTEEDDDMLPEYDFSHPIKRWPFQVENPYAELCTEPVTIKLTKETAAYFQEESYQTRIPFDELISVRLAKYVESQQRPSSNPIAIFHNSEITISLGTETYNYFRQLADDSEMWFAVYMRFFLADCAKHKRKLMIDEFFEE